MALLARLLGVRRYLEIGTYTGYSALAIALALDPVLTCEIDTTIAPTAQRYWSVADKVELRLGPALNTLDGLLAQGETRSFRHGVHRRRQGKPLGLL